IGIAPVRCGADSLHVRQRTKEQERDYNDNGLNFGFHRREVSQGFWRPVENKLPSSSIAWSYRVAIRVWVANCLTTLPAALLSSLRMDPAASASASSSGERNGLKRLLSIAFMNAS